MSRKRRLAQAFFDAPYEKLTKLEQRVIHDVVERRRTSRNVAGTTEQGLTFGERVADQVAAFGGSWTFIIIFGLVLVGWVILNSILLARMGDSFDPYPYILLNLVLSMLAAIQAPVIMMSQNRQAAKDRADMAHDYEVNLKSEMELMQLHDKMDVLAQQKWQELLDLQARQLDKLDQIRERLEALEAGRAVRPSQQQDVGVAQPGGGEAAQEHRGVSVELQPQVGTLGDGEAADLPRRDESEA
jgi:uncharacterized membrane protein